MNLQITRKMSILTNLHLIIGTNESSLPGKSVSLLNVCSQLYLHESDESNQIEMNKQGGGIYMLPIVHYGQTILSTRSCPRSAH